MIQVALHPLAQALQSDRPVSNIVPLVHNANQAKPTGVKNEKPEHRMMVLMRANGRTNQEIADYLGYSVAQVGTVLSSPWAKHMLAQMTEDAFDEQLRPLLNSAAAEAITTVIELMNSAESESVRLKAAQDILDRTRGKAVQRIESISHKTKLDAEEEIQQLRKELSA